MPDIANKNAEHSAELVSHKQQIIYYKYILNITWNILKLKVLVYLKFKLNMAFFFYMAILPTLKSRNGKLPKLGFKSKISFRI